MGKSIKKIRVTALVLLISLMSGLFQGCNSYRDLDDLIFITSVLVDTNDKLDGVVVYFEAFKPTRSSQQSANSETRIVYRMESNTISGAIDELHRMTSSTLTFSHNKIILFTKRLAKHGFGDYFDLFDRSQEFVVRTLIAIYDADAKIYEDTEVKEEKMVGLYLFDLLQNNESVSPMGVKIDIKEFMDQRLVGDKVNSVPIVSTYSKDNKKNVFVINGISLVKGYKQIGELRGMDPLYFNLLLKNEANGEIDVNNPQEKGKLCVLQIMNYSLKSELEYKDGKLTVKREITVNTDFSEAQKKIDINKKLFKQLEIEAEEQIEENCIKLFKQYKEKQIDVFDIQEEFDRKYPHAENKNVITSTDLKVKAIVNIEGTTTTEKFK
ncbi:MAG: hypothetical protein K0R90_1076 [Oscillospiraceae bacterium]|nr:hypothetical protein [Oscillospiraceae bacterium]